MNDFKLKSIKYDLIKRGYPICDIVLLPEHEGYRESLCMKLNFLDGVLYVSSHHYHDKGPELVRSIITDIKNVYQLVEEARNCNRDFAFFIRTQINTKLDFDNRSHMINDYSRKMMIIKKISAKYYSTDEFIKSSDGIDLTELVNISRPAKSDSLIIGY